ncbi:MFS transporter [Microlunatus soli]|uniref:Drug resistance transporter, EmrB/QacA subfamily n=1 Tax=Microlunatus soli TaxID=630515 RepID=A0A1H2AJT3_9ACTN|nr:MFS transporter [Microlunatus soli]SDT46211.1 drug resistance transporter, EmrB/QacA subfamily [Microlunatus soli]
MSTAVAERSPSPDPTPSNGHQAGEELSHKEILEVMTGLLAALFTALISSTIVSTALPTIMSDLHGTQRQYTWVITASLLAMTISTPIMGKLSDLFNKKLLIQFSIVLFVAGSVFAGFSTEIWQMMVGRAAQGIAMGGLTALTQSIMGTIIAPRQRGRYSGYMGAVMAVATVSGPLLGGVITDNLDWRWCFFVCVPLAVIALILLQVTLHLPALTKRKVKIDYFGALFLAIAAAAPMLWVTFAGKDYDWISWQSGVFLLAFLAAAGIAVAIELNHSEPIVPIKVLRNSTTALMIIAGMAVGVAMFGSGTFLTQYFQLAGGHSPTKAGLMTIPMILAQLLSSVIGGQLVSRTGRWKPIMVIGTVLVMGGMGTLGLTLDSDTPYWQVAIWMAVAGIGIGALVQNIVLAVQNTVDVKDIGASSATISFFRSLGGAVGVSVLGAVLADNVETKTLDGIRSLPAALQGVAAKLLGGSGGGDLDLSALPDPIENVVRHAYGDTFGTLFLIAGIIAIAAFIAVLLVREVPLRTTVSMQSPADSGDAAAVDPQAATAPAAVAAAEQAVDLVSRPTPATTNGSASGEPVVNAASLTTNGRSPDQTNGAQSADAFDDALLDDPAGRRSVAALDVLTAAQERVRQYDAGFRDSLNQVAVRLDTVSHEVDAAMGGFHRELQAIREDLMQAKPGSAEPQPDGAGGSELRQYEYNLLLDSQQTAERVTASARGDADRIISDAEKQRADLERRIEQLREVERELSARVSGQLAATDERSTDG